MNANALTLEELNTSVAAGNEPEANDSIAVLLAKLINALLAV